MSRSEFNEKRLANIIDLENKIANHKASIILIEEKLGMLEDDLAEYEKELERAEDLTYEGARALYLEERT